jgi:hypothetical protein
MNVSSIGSASSMTSGGFLNEPPLSPGSPPAPAPAVAPIPQLRTVDPTPASEALSDSEPQAPVTPLAPAPAAPPAPPTSVSGSEPQSSAEAPVGDTPSLESQLLRMRLVTPDQIASAMREEAETGRPIAEIVVANGWVSADDLARLQSPEAAPAVPAVAPAPEPVVAPSVAVAPPPEPVEAAAPAPAPEPAPAPAPAPAPVAPAAAAHTGVGARVLVRLENGERIQVGEFDGFEDAKARARGLMAELMQAAEWPFLSGRYVRPEAIVSIDIDLTSL